MSVLKSAWNRVMYTVAQIPNVTIPSKVMDELEQQGWKFESTEAPGRIVAPIIVIPPEGNTLSFKQAKKEAAAKVYDIA